MPLQRRLQRVVPGLAAEVVERRDVRELRKRAQRLLHRPREPRIGKRNSELRLARQVAEQQVAVPSHGVEGDPIELDAMVSAEADVACVEEQVAAVSADVGDGQREVGRELTSHRHVEVVVLLAPGLVAGDEPVEALVVLLRRVVVGQRPCKLGYGSLRYITGSCAFGVGRVVRVTEMLAL